MKFIQNNPLIFRKGVFPYLFPIPYSRKTWSTISVSLCEPQAQLKKKKSSTIYYELHLKKLHVKNLVETSLDFTILNGEYNIKMTWIGQTLEWVALWKVNIQSQLTDVVLECFFKAGLKRITGHWLTGNGLFGKGTDPKLCPFHPSLKLKWGSAHSLRKDIKLQILQFCCACNFPMLLVGTWEGP